jgi:ElaB/YqjD/DUF883 family membrane-anchored ribosome-binding protein
MLTNALIVRSKVIRSHASELRTLAHTIQSYLRSSCERASQRREALSQKERSVFAYDSKNDMAIHQDVLLA